MNYAWCMSNVSALIKCKSIIRDEFKINWYELPESSIREAQWDRLCKTHKWYDCINEV